jgi:hypothetical protein
MKRALVILTFLLWATIFLSDTANAARGYHAGFVGVRRVVVVRPPILPGPAVVAGTTVVAVATRPYPPYWRSMYCPPASAPFYQPYGGYGNYGW